LTRYSKYEAADLPVEQLMVRSADQFEDSEAGWANNPAEQLAQ
jgi:hypothetical protein